MKLNLILLPAVAGLASVLMPSARAEFFQAPFGPGGTWRIYETPRSGLSFKDALSAARSSVDPVTNSVPGDLVSVTSLAKNTFLFRTVGRAPGDSWIGLTDREGVAPGAFESQGEADNRMMGWAYTNGDPHVYQNFNGGEPNDAGGAEDAVHFGGGGLWNDNVGGWNIDEPNAPTIKPGSSGNETRVYAPNFMVEYPVNSPTPLPGIRYGMVFPHCADLNLPLNTAGNWSVREIRGLTLAGNVFDSVDKALSGEGTFFDGQSPYLDFADPETSAAGGPALTSAPFPYLSNTAGAADDNVLSIARTRVNITPAKAGLYSIRVHGDDGFAMRFKGVPWTSVNDGGTNVNRGYIDPLDPTTVVFERGTGDANTLATIELAAGEYDVEFLHWEGGGGAYYEVSATSGDATLGNLMQWQPFGSNTDLPAVDTQTVARLAEPATVINANLASRQFALPAVRYLLDNAVRNTTSAQFTNLVIGEGGMPNNNGGDNYITKVTGQIILNNDANGNSTPGELIDVTFRLNCDDGANMRIIGQDFLAVNATGNNRALLDYAGDTIISADNPTGDTDVRGHIRLTEGVTYTFVSYMYEYGGGSKYEMYWNLGNEVDSNLTVANPMSDTGVVRLNPDATVTNMPHVNWDSQQTMPEVKNVTDAVTPVIGTNAGIFSSLEIAEGSMPANNGGDNYAVKVTGRIKLLADANANATPNELIDVSFRLGTDDGSNLRIVGQDFFATNGGTTRLLDVAGDMVLTGDFPTGNNNALGVIKLTEGQTYEFVSYMYEFGGGSQYRLQWELGDKSAGMEIPATLSTLDTDAVFINSEPDPVNNAGTLGALVLNTKFGSRQTILPHVAKIMDENIALGQTQQTTVTTVVMRGDAGITNGRPGNGILSQATVMPVGQDQDNYMTRINGKIIVDDQDGTPGESITLTFGIFADDGMNLRIIGQDFNLATDTSGDGTAYLSPVSGDMTLTADFTGGNTSTFGRIQLVEGTYDFVAHHHEGGGGAGAEIWVAEGDKTAGFDSTYKPLNDQLGASAEASLGIPLIAGVDLDLDDDGIPGAWETANGLSDANAADALLDGDGDGLNNAAEYAAGTNPALASSAFRIAGVSLTSGGGVQISVPTKLGHHYHLYGSPDLAAPWTELGRALPTADGTTTWTITAPTPPEKYFFRVVAERCD